MEYNLNKGKQGMQLKNMDVAQKENSISLETSAYNWVSSENRRPCRLRLFISFRRILNSFIGILKMMRFDPNEEIINIFLSG